MTRIHIINIMITTYMNNATDKTDIPETSPTYDNAANATIGLNSRHEARFTDDQSKPRTASVVDALASALPRSAA